MIEQRDGAIKRREVEKENGNRTFLAKAMKFFLLVSHRSSEASFLLRLLRVTGCDASRFEILFVSVRRATWFRYSFFFSLSRSLLFFFVEWRLNLNAPWKTVLLRWKFCSRALNAPRRRGMFVLQEAWEPRLPRVSFLAGRDASRMSRRF